MVDGDDLIVPKLPLALLAAGRERPVDDCNATIFAVQSVSTSSDAIYL